MPEAGSRGSKGQCGPWLAVASERRGGSDDALTRRGVVRLSETPALAKHSVLLPVLWLTDSTVLVLLTSIASSPTIVCHRLFVEKKKMSQGQAAIPSQPRAKQLRACLLCSIIQTPADFRKYGCPNCEEIMQVNTMSR